MNSSETELRGTVERVTFHNEENGFAVLKVEVEKRRGLVTLLGSVPSIHPGESVVAQGKWIEDPRHGQQFKASGLTVDSPSTLQGIERYLSSGLIEGIGPVYGKRLIKKFGADIFSTIENRSAKLEEVDGIGRDRRLRIKESWEKQRAVKEIMVFLHAHGVSTGLGVRIFKTYGNDALKVLRRDPYQLARDIHGVGFATADKIAQDLGMASDALERCRAGLWHLLRKATGEGHCALPRGVLLREASELLSVPEERAEESLEDCLREKKLIADKIGNLNEAWIFLPNLYYAERGIAQKIRAMGEKELLHPKLDIEKALKWVENQTGKTLGESQREAVRKAVSHRVLIITGGPGVGKTTILDAILKILKAKGILPVLCAPTGRAAKRLMETTGQTAKTIHRLLQAQSGTGFVFNKENRLGGELFVVDESSMIDLPLFWAFLQALPDRAQLLLVGDVDQLPPVGAGQPFADLISSGLIPVARLTEIFRQSQESRIIIAAHQLNKGQVPYFDKEDKEADFFFIPQNSPEEILESLLRFATRHLPERKKIDPLQDLQVLSPMHRGILGTANLNQMLQEKLNPPHELKYEIERFGKTFRVGDKVLQTQNNYQKEVYNGDIGYITAIETEPLRLQIRFDAGRLISYELGELDEIQLAYAISIHKSQGSEFSCVVIPISMQHYILLQKKLFYTGITRGKKCVLLIGE